MAYGWETYDASGNLLAASSLATGIILGRIVLETGNWDGSLQDSDLTRGVPFFWVQSFDSAPYDTPTVTFTGGPPADTINWVDNSGELTTQSIWYGIL